MLYRIAEEEVPEEDYEVPLFKAQVLQEGNDITIVGYGTQLRHIRLAAATAEKEKGVSCEVIDLRTINPWDVETVEVSVKKTGRLIVSHEAQCAFGVGAEIAQTMQERCFLHLVGRDEGGRKRRFGGYAD